MPCVLNHLRRWLMVSLLRVVLLVVMWLCELAGEGDLCCGKELSSLLVRRLGSMCIGEADKQLAGNAMSAVAGTTGGRAALLAVL
jgi:hypothetical protein